MPSRDTASTLNWAERDKIIEIMESYGFACHDSEDTDELRDALRQNIDDGTIPASVLDEIATPSAKDRAVERGGFGL